MLINNDEYMKVLDNILNCIKTSQYKVMLNANLALMHRNWIIGNYIQENSNWGQGFLKNLSRDIKANFPDVSGFSERNLRDMKKFASIFEEDDIDAYGLAGITWYHHKALMGRVKSKDAYIWYVEKTIQNGWSHDMLEFQIDSNLYMRQVEKPKIQNFEGRLPDQQSELAIQTMKDPYIFDFVQFREGMIERDIETELVNNVKKFLIELGTGFAFVGEQFEVNVNGDEFFIDLLFYHYRLHCFVAIDLKTGKFTPDMAGKMNFYLSVLDDMVKSDLDNPSIGLILCRNENKLVAEYSLKDMSKPIGVSEYKLINDLPKELQNILPTSEDIETRVMRKYDCD
ncbi:MAG: DUF1016 family protein [Lachnospiraceae bacterium]|nr:DUF1016 family protein [Lachnospiraceae bacterium]